MKYLPSLEQVSKQVIVSLCCAVVVALVLSKNPAIKKLVIDNQLTF